VSLPPLSCMAANERRHEEAAQALRATCLHHVISPHRQLRATGAVALRALQVSWTRSQAFHATCWTPPVGEGTVGPVYATTGALRSKSREPSFVPVDVAFSLFPIPRSPPRLPPPHHRYRLPSPPPAFPLPRLVPVASRHSRR
jgi:hypothetical protein